MVRPERGGSITTATVGGSTMGIEGQTIDAKYVVKQRLGGGGMGEVYDAVHGETERHVAIKVLFSDYAGHPEALERFRR